MKRSVFIGILMGAMSMVSLVDAQEPGSLKAGMDTFQIPSHGSGLNALVYVAAGKGPHPVVVLLHGFPGNEKNLDLAQEIRRAGWDVLYFNYRGAWGTPGDFSFQHSIEDVASAVAYLREPAHAERLRADPKRIVLIGHRLGGFIAVQAAAADPGILGIGLISAADMRGRMPLPVKNDAETLKQLATAYEAQGLAPLAGCTGESLAKEMLQHAAEWDFAVHAEALKSRPALVVTSADGLAPYDDAFAAALRKAGDGQVTTIHFETDHSYSDKRLELASHVVLWLAGVHAAAQ